MSEESGQERTEDPTERRREQAKEKGQVARSKELNSAIVMLAGSSAVLIFGPTLMEQVGSIANASFQFTRNDIFDISSLFKHLNESIATMIFALMPIFLVIVLASLAGPILLSGWSFSVKSLRPKAERLSPLKGLKRMFAIRSLVELLKTLVKLLVILFAASLIVYTQLPKLLSLGFGDAVISLGSALRILAWSYFAFSSTLILIAGIDIPFQLWEHLQGLKMSKQEIRDEYKEMEGNPQLKGHIRHMQRELARTRMLEAIPAADVIITNPTHYAVALRYDDKGISAPVVVAKGKELIALQIRQLATTHVIPIIESPALARAIFYSTKLNHEIPQGLYVAVAQILAYVYQLKRAKKEGTPKPKLPTDLTIPDNLKHD